MTDHYAVLEQVARGLEDEMDAAMATLEELGMSQDEAHEFIDSALSAAWMTWDYAVDR